MTISLVSERGTYLFLNLSIKTAAIAFTFQVLNVVNVLRGSLFTLPKHSEQHQPMSDKLVNNWIKVHITCLTSSS